MVDAADANQIAAWQVNWFAAFTGGIKPLLGRLKGDADYLRAM
jgi:hypothetical protein